MRWIAVLLVLLVGCQDVRYPEAPENLIPEETMMDIMADAYSGHAARSVNNKVLRSNKVALDSALYIKYQVDSLQFARSNAFYTTDLDKYTRILQGVEERLIARKKVIDSAMNEERLRLQEKKKDSSKAKPAAGISKGAQTSSK